MSPSFLHKARGESSNETGIFTVISHSNSYNGKKRKYIKIKLIYKCNVYYLHNSRLTVQDKTEKFVVLSTRS